MANYLVAGGGIHGSIEYCLAALVSALSGINTTKTLHVVDIQRRGNDYCGLVIYDQ